jgi:hypothetical protein
MLYQHFIYVASRRLLFVYVPKVACTNFKAVLRRLQGAADYLDAAIAHDRSRSGLCHLDQHPDRECIVRDPAVLRLSCVRNPYTRLLSAYLNKIEPLNDGDPEWLGPAARGAHAAIREHAGHVDFGAFADWIACSSHPLTSNEHWIAQSCILDPERVSYDFVGRFERLQQDAATLLQMMGADIGFPTREAVDFPATHAGSRLAEYYTPTIAARVHAAYADDFRNFGYAAELPA